jgi:hypothetical protein
MIYKGQHIDDRFGVVEPFLKWADAEIARYEVIRAGSDIHTGVRAATCQGLLGRVKENLIEINEQAVRDHDGNIAAAREAN